MPPCISQLDGGLVQVAIEVEDRAQRSAITSKYLTVTFMGYGIGMPYNNMIMVSLEAISLTLS